MVIKGVQLSALSPCFRYRTSTPRVLGDNILQKGKGTETMKLTDCITDYLNHIRHERNLAATTCLHYQCWLRAYMDWLKANGYPSPTLEDAFTAPVLRRYQYHKAESGRAASNRA